jgi:hypothetical protein
LNISFKKNQYSKVIKYLADMCWSWPPCNTSGHPPNSYHWHQNHFLMYSEFLNDFFTWLYLCWVLPQYCIICVIVSGE